MKKLIPLLLLISAPAMAYSVESVVARCDLDQSQIEKSKMDEWVSRGYKLVSVVAIDVPRPTPGWYPSYCSFIFARQ